MSCTSDSWGHDSRATFPDLTLWSPDVSEGDSPEFENITVTMQQIITDEKKDPIGRFTCNASPRTVLEKTDLYGR